MYTVCDKAFFIIVRAAKQLYLTGISLVQILPRTHINFILTQ